MLEAGYTRRQIADALQVNESTVSIHAIRLGYRVSTRPTVYDWEAIRTYYEDGHSRSESQARFGCSSGAWDHAVARGDIVPRARNALPYPHETQRAVGRLLEQGLTQAEIARTLALSKSTIAFHVRNLGVQADERFNRRYDWDAVQRAYDAGLSVRECCEKFGFAKATWSKAVKRGAVKARSQTLPIEVLLVAGRRQTGRTHLKQRLLDEGLKENRCEICGITEWNGKPLNMELHHVNGDGTDNRLENLQLPCGNCHAQTDNWGGRGMRRNGQTRNGRKAA